MWWTWIVAAVVAVAVIYMFGSLVAVQTRWVTRRTGRRAEDLYREHAGSMREQRQTASELNRMRDEELGAGHRD
jgi:uncharacterized protein YjiS (DUF1127 family)